MCGNPENVGKGGISTSTESKCGINIESSNPKNSNGDDFSGDDFSTVSSRGTNIGSSSLDTPGEDGVSTRGTDIGVMKLENLGVGLVSTRGAGGISISMFSSRGGSSTGTGLFA